MIKCTVCGYDNKDDAKFCLNCGSPISHEKVSHAIDDVSEERTVMLDPASMQRRVQEEIQRERDRELQQRAATPPPPAGGMPPPPPPRTGAVPPPPAQMAPPTQRPSAPPPPPPPGMGGGATPPMPASQFGGQAGMMAPGGEPPNTTTYLVLSIVETVCCCLPLGVASIVFTVLAMNEVKNGNYFVAEEKLKIAKICLIVGAIGGVLVGLLYFFGGLASALQGG
ncbi:CD225/dispanin family protein [Candidatus Poribacteria bacterium]|nr:CD225/dispanin family protein [Candidatus Poribacteria bacterium]